MCKHPECCALSTPSAPKGPQYPQQPLVTLRHTLALAFPVPFLVFEALQGGHRMAG